jgi:hypothetical protein
MRATALAAAGPGAATLADRNAQSLIALSI